MKVFGISAVLRIPGGFAMMVTVPVELVQYYGFMLRAVQEIMYLYGFPELDFDEDNTIDSATMNIIILCIGVMYCVSGANNVIKVTNIKRDEGVEKKLMNKALTKGVFYPIVKKVAK